MSKVFLLLAICLTSTAALPQLHQERTIGGAATTVSEHPYAAIILYASNNVNFQPVCGGAIINSRSIATAQSCWTAPNNQVALFRARVGSANANSGGSLHTITRFFAHFNYVPWNQDNNFGLLRLTSVINFGLNVRPIPVAPLDYDLADYQKVLAIGLSRTTPTSELQLSAVELRTVNQERCTNVYGVNFVTPFMLCAGWETGGRGPSLNDIGAPLVHNKVLVGITSYTFGNGDKNFPSIYARVSRYNNWLRTNT